MIDLTNDRREIERRTRLAMNTHAIRGVAEIARRAINETAAGAFVALCYHLARAYSEGYMAGWKAGRNVSSEVAPLPDLDH